MSIASREQVLVQRERWRGIEAVVLSNDVLRVVTIPDRGGKIASLIRQETGYEYLLQADRVKGYQPLTYGADFESGDLSGFDECLPTIAKCEYPLEPFLGTRLPDHGDVWCLPAKVETTGAEVKFVTSLTSLPLRFSKSVRVQGNSIRLDYELTNLSQSIVRFLWSAHPLLSVQSQAEIVLPPEVNEVELGWSKGDRLGQARDLCSWPLTKERSGRVVDLSKVLGPSEGTADKLFTPRLRQGFCGLLLPEVNESISFHFDPALIPYLGIWICQGGWPLNGTEKQFTVALEPCTGRPDSLEEAIKREECMVVEGYGRRQWWLRIEVAARNLAADRR